MHKRFRNAKEKYNQFLYVLAKLIEGTEAYLSFRNLLLSGIKLIGNDDLMHGLDDLRKALEMLLKKKLHNKLPIERQSSKRVVKLIEENGWGKVGQTLWPYLKYIFGSPVKVCGLGIDLH